MTDYDTTWLEGVARNSDDEIWVIVFDGKILEGAKKRAFNSEGDAKKSFAHLVWDKNRTSRSIREELEKKGRLKFKKLKVCV